MDPLSDLSIDVQSFDIPRLVTVYPDNAQLRWWVKSWWNGSEDGEMAVEIEERVALEFLMRKLSKEHMLNEYYPKQVEMYKSAIAQAKETLLKQITI